LSEYDCEMIRRICGLLVPAMFLFSVDLCVGADIYWYLASSMAKPGREVVQKYNAQGDSEQVILITGGSGQLLSKIAGAGKGDFYTPASSDYVEKIEKLGFVHNYKPFLVQTPVFALSHNGSRQIKDVNDIGRPGVKVGLGNPRTMALGRSYAGIRKTLDPGLAAAIDKNVVVEAMNVSQIMNYLKQGIIDVGISFDTTANVHSLEYVEIPQSSCKQEKVPLVRLNFSGGQSGADFERFLFENILIFTRYGFRTAN
jgi:molybdate transport system substrate-binding protein